MWADEVFFYVPDRLNCPDAAMRSLQLARQHAATEHERLVYEGWILYDTGNCEEGLCKAEESIRLQRSFEAYFLKAYALADSSPDPSCSTTVVSLLEDALKCPSDRLRKGQVGLILSSLLACTCMHLNYLGTTKSVSIFSPSLKFDYFQRFAHSMLQKILFISCYNRRARFLRTTFLQQINLHYLILKRAVHIRDLFMFIRQ